MDVLLVYCDVRSPSRYLRYLDTGVYHQLLADSQIDVASELLHADRRPEEVIDSFRRNPAKLVAFNIDEFNASASFGLIRRLRADFPDTPVAAFGVYTVLAPDTIVAEKTLDYLIIGEGEAAMYELASQVIRGSEPAGLKNVWRMMNGRIERNPLRPLQDNVDTLPYANRSLFAQEPCSGMESERVLYVSASRGCPHECLFCYSPVLKKAYEGKGGYYRIRSVPHLAGEILGELRRQEYTRIVFLDEYFPLEKNWLRQLGQRIGGEHAVPFQATVATEKVDEETLELLKAAGCRKIQIGLETGNEAFRKRIATRNLGTERVKAVAAAARQLGIAVITSNMIGSPLESEPLAQETYALNQLLAPDEIQCHVYQPIPSTNLYQYARDHQYIVSPEASPDFTSLNMVLPELPADVVRKHLYRMHFLNVMQKLKTLPHSEGYHDFVHDLPKAKFHLKHSQAIDVGLGRRGGETFAYLAIENGSDCRFSVELRERSFIRFWIFVPQAAVLRLKHAGTKLIAEAVWIAGGVEQSVFYRAMNPNEFAYGSKWQECFAPAPDGGAGEMMFRVSTLPELDIKATVFWGGIALSDVQGLSGSTASAEKLRNEYESQLADYAKQVASLKRDMEDARRDELQARHERDERGKRIAELQLRITDLENDLKSAKLAVAELESRLAERQSGIGGKISGIFKKS